MSERRETWDLSEGLGRIRWGDDIASIRREYPEAYEKRRRMGRNPTTGEGFFVTTGLVIPRFLTGPDELFMEASVGFNEELLVDGVAIAPELSEEEPDADAWQGTIDRMIRFLGEKLALQPLDVDLMEQEWLVGRVPVRLFREKLDRFTLTVEAPGA